VLSCAVVVPLFFLLLSLFLLLFFTSRL
jgi:hypothetical protein